MLRRLAPLLLLAGAALMLSSEALAGGFLVPRYGGEQGHPTTDDISAIYYNPAGLALTPGTRLHLNGVFALRTASYVRPEGAIDNVGTGTPADAVAANAGRATLLNGVAVPFIAAATNFGVPGLGVGAAFHVPFGGAARWRQNEAFARGALAQMYPGAVDGVQRWSTIEGQIRSLYITAAGAYTIPKLRLSFGLGVNVVINEVNTVRARNADGTDDLVAGTTLKEGRSLIDVKNVTASLAAGVIWQPVHNLWIGVSYQSQPGFGQNRLTGTLTNKLGVSEVTEQQVELLQTLPDVVRVGLRWRPEPRWELRLFGDYQRWSVFRNQCLLDATNPDRACNVVESGPNRGAVDQEAGGAGIILVLPRNWKDGWGLRVGASYFLRPWHELFVGAGYDANVVPDETIDTLFDQEKMSLSAGWRGEIVRRRLLLAITYTHVIYFERTVEPRPRDAAGMPIAPQPPSRNPDGAGIYNQSVALLSLALEYRF